AENRRWMPCRQFSAAGKGKCPGTDKSGEGGFSVSFYKGGAIMKRSKFTRVLAGLLAVVMVLVCLPTAGAAQAGQFVLAVVTQEQVLVEPETVSYGPGDTVRTALKNSGHSFEGIDTGFVFAIDGVED